MADNIWEDEAYTAKRTMWLDPDMVQVLSGKLRNKAMCELEIDLDTYCNTYFEATDNEAPEIEAEKRKTRMTLAGQVFNSILAHLSMFPCGDKVGA